MKNVEIFQCSRHLFLEAVFILSPYCDTIDNKKLDRFLERHDKGGGGRNDDKSSLVSISFI